MIPKAMSLALVTVAVLLAACGRGRTVDDAALMGANADSANWLSYGRTYSEQRFRPLRQIDGRSVRRLGLAWWLDLGTRNAAVATVRTPAEWSGAMT